MTNNSRANIIRVVAVLVIFLAVFLIVYGSILPLRKARLYIRSSQELGSVKSVPQMKVVLDKMFDFPSPVGDEEVAKFTGNTLFPVITNSQQGEQVSLAVLQYLEPHMQTNNVRHLTLVGRMYIALWQNYHKAEYLDKAEEYYLMSYEIGPSLPQSLYALFEIYRDKGDEVRMVQFGERILELWPQETRIQKIEPNQ